MPIQLSGSLVITGSITTTGVITMSGSIASASYSSTSDLLQGTGSVGFTTTASFNAVSSSQQQVSASYIALSGSYNVFSGSASTRITANSSSIQQVSSSQQQISASLLQVSASYISLSGSYNTYSSSVSTRTTQIENVYATTGSNSFRANQSITGSLVVSSTITAQTLVVQTVTSSIVYSSGSNIFGCDLNSRQTFTGSVLITGSLTIAGASSATSYSGATIFGSTIACSPIGCFATSCATAFIGGTMSGTTIYGSTAVCSAVGKFTTCLDLGGALTGTSATFSSTITLPNNTYLQFKDNGGTARTILTIDASNTTVIRHAASGGYFALQNFANTVNNLLIADSGAATFSSTITGTTIYGSTAVCSPVGKFTSCIDAGNITTSDFVNVSAASSAYYGLKIAGVSGAARAIFLAGQVGYSNGFTIDYTGTAMKYSFIDGNVGIGTTCPVNKLQIGTMSYPYSGNEFAIGSGNVDFAIDVTATSVDMYSSAAMSFATNTTERMRITCAGITCFGFTVCAPCFATISDYRMKSNIRPIEGLSIIMNTKPYKFEYNYDCSTSFGMIAHELQDTVPEAVFGYKDGEVMQGVDYMKLLPIAIKAIQEQQCIINTLKTCLGII